MTDPWKGMGGDQHSFGRRGTVITPGAADLDVASRLVVLAAGDATIVPVDNGNTATLTFTGLTVGQVLPYIVRRVTAATATLATLDG